MDFWAIFWLKSFSSGTENTYCCMGSKCDDHAGCLFFVYAVFLG